MQCHCAVVISCDAAADLVPAKVKMYIFYGMPKKTKLKTIFAPLCGSSPEKVMAPAVADNHKLGYDKLYRLLLDHVSIAAALLLSLIDGHLYVCTAAFSAIAVSCSTAFPLSAWFELCLCVCTSLAWCVPQVRPYIGKQLHVFINKII